MLTLPAALALMVTARPVMAALFVRGDFTAADAALSAQSLAAYAIGLPAFVLVKVLAPAFFARGDTATPVRVGIASLALNLALNFALMRPLQHVGPPLATALAATFNMGVLGAILWRRGFLRPDRRLASRAARMLGASLAMSAVLWALERMLWPAFVHTQLLRLVGLAGLIGVGMGLYGVMAQVLGLMDVRDVAKAVRRRLARGKPEPVSPGS